MRRCVCPRSLNWWARNGVQGQFVVPSVWPTTAPKDRQRVSTRDARSSTRCTNWESGTSALAIVSLPHAGRVSSRWRNSSAVSAICRRAAPPRESIHSPERTHRMTLKTPDVSPEAALGAGLAAILLGSVTLNLMVAHKLVAPANVSELMDTALLQLERSCGLPGSLGAAAQVARACSMSTATSRRSRPWQPGARRRMARADLPESLGRGTLLFRDLDSVARSGAPYAA